jgi:hypothetical protein
MSDDAVLEKAPEVLEADKVKDVAPSDDTQTSTQAEKELNGSQADNIQHQEEEPEDKNQGDEDDKSEKESGANGITKLSDYPKKDGGRGLENIDESPKALSAKSIDFSFLPSAGLKQGKWVFGSQPTVPRSGHRSGDVRPTTAVEADEKPALFGGNNQFAFTQPHQSPRPIPLFPSTVPGKVGLSGFLNEKPSGPYVETKIIKARGYIDGSRLYIGRPAPSSLEEIDVFLTISDIGYHTVLQRPLAGFEQATETSSAKQGKLQDAGRTIRKPLWFQRHKRPVAIVNDDEVARLDDDRFFWVPVYPKPDVAQAKPQHLHHTAANPSSQLPMDHAHSVPALERTLRIEFETKLAALRSDLERKIADIGRKDARVLHFEIRLKQSERRRKSTERRLWGCERRFGRWYCERNPRRWRCRRRPRIRSYRRKSGRRSRMRSMR